MPSALRHRGAVPAVLFLTAITLRIWWAAPFADALPTNDPDGYVQLARELGDGTRPWRWTLKAVQWIEFFKAPLYQGALSVFTANPDLFPLPKTALLLHAFLNSCTVVALYGLGVAMHTRRAGIGAAAVYALWIPNILVTNTFWQEHLFIPLLAIGVALLARAVDREQPVRNWVVAGVVFGLCALTRSAATYFIPVAVLWYVAVMPKTRIVFARAGGFVGGFAVATLPYVFLISMALGRFMPIEDSGAVALRRMEPANPDVKITQFMKDTTRGPTGVETARYLLADFSADPAGFTGRHGDYLRLLLKPAGGSFLLHDNVSGPAAAVRLKSGVHLAMDLPLALAAVLWPFGVVLSRNKTVAVLVGLLVMQYLVLLSLTQWAGTRYRSPVDPFLFALAAVVFAGHYGPRRPRALTMAAVVSIGFALLIGESLRTTIQARPNYGIAQWVPAAVADASFEGRAGANVIATTRALVLTLQPLTHRRPDASVVVSVRLSGRLVDIIKMTGTESRQLRYQLDTPGVVYLELSADGADGLPVTMRITIP